MTRPTVGSHLDRARLVALVVALTAALLGASACRAQQAAPLATTRLAADTYLIAAPTGNLVAGVGADGAVVVGVQSPAITARVAATVAALNPAPIRWVVATAGPDAYRDGTAGWDARNVPVVMYEGLIGGGRRFRAPIARIGFSEVIQLRANDDFVHVVHQPNGYSDSDVSAHFERANVLYLGNAFTTDGYPSIDPARGGSVDGMIAEADKFLQFPATMQIVPGRGPVSNVAGLRAYRGMLAAVRERVQPMVAAGRTLAEVQASRPTADQDGRWGRGPVPAAAFVASVYHSLGGK